MIRICAWCKQELPHGRADGVRDGTITHGICDSCAQNLASPHPAGVQEFLEDLDAPVFLAGSDSRTLPANGCARKLAGGNPEEAANTLLGDIYECENAVKPGGCGRTVCCRACTIQLAVSETLDSGNAVLRRPAYLTASNGNGKKHFLISTFKAGDAVMVKIDESE